MTRETANAVVGDHRYVLVDEYQDTNYIQEQILLKLAGAQQEPVRGRRRRPESLPFSEAQPCGTSSSSRSGFPDCTIVKLTTNYRSHRAVVERYDRWMGVGRLVQPEWSSIPLRQDD